MNAASWIADEVISTGPTLRVRHSETGQIGYRRLRDVAGRLQPFGSVWDRPECESAAGLLRQFDGDAGALADYLRDHPEVRPANVIAG